MFGRTKSDLFDFLDYIGEHGLVAPATVSARKASAKKVLNALSSEETEDVLAIDVDDVCDRFVRLYKNDYTAGSLQSYVSRLKSTLEDFERFLTNPAEFKRSSKRHSHRHQLAEVAPGYATEISPMGARSVRTDGRNLVPIAIREDLVVKIDGLPFDLTEPEAKRIANVVLAMAS